MQSSELTGDNCCQNLNNPLKCPTLGFIGRGVVRTKNQRASCRGEMAVDCCKELGLESRQTTRSYEFCRNWL